MADPEIQDLVAKGNEVQAIKRYRELTGLGLKEAKDAIDRTRG
jgi:ribosomal protein L7/L12